MVSDFVKLLTGGYIPYPISVMIEVTTRCNLKCMMCPRSIVYTPTADIDMRVFKQLRGLMENVWEVRPFGFGEAFVHKEIDAILKHCKQYGVVVTVVTNGTLINRERANLLVDIGLNNLVVSMDAVDPQLFREIRGGSELQTVVENIKKINRAKAEKRSEFPRITIQMVGMMKNIRDFPGMVRLAHSLDIKTVNLVALTEHDPQRMQSLVRCPELARRYLLEGKQIADKRGIQLEIARLYLDELNLTEAFSDQGGASPVAETKKMASRAKNYLNWEKLKNLSWSGAFSLFKSRLDIQPPRWDPSVLTLASRKLVDCLDPWYATVINHKGEVNPCCMCQEVMGNVLEDSFDDIWRGERYREFRERILTGDPPTDCRNCAKAGWYRPYELEDWVEVGVNDRFGVQVGTGWYNVEESDGGIRWSRKEGILCLKNTGKGKLVLVLSPSPYPDRRLTQRGEIYVNEVRVGDFHLARPGEKRLVFNIPEFSTEDLVVRISCRNENIPDRIFHNGDIRRLGVGLKRTWLTD